MLFVLFPNAFSLREIQCNLKDAIFNLNLSHGEAMASR